MTVDLAREATFRLAEVEVRPSTREVVSSTRREIVEPRVMQVLVALGRRRGEVVSRDELIAECWGGRAVGEDAIHRCIGALRRLAETFGGFQVSTVTRVGYRLSVNEHKEGANCPPEPVLAVLAFDNLSGDPELGYFSDGVSEDIHQTLARAAGLKVLGRASSFQFRGADKATARIAAALKATHILDGSVRRSGSRVRIAAQLIECSHETTIWSDRYDRDLTDIFALQDEIGTSVATALKATLTRSQHWPVDPAAHDLILRALAYDGVGVEATVRQVRMLEGVVDLAPGFARGWANLAGWTAALLQKHPEEAAAAGLTRDRAIAAAEIALRLDPRMGAAYQALGLLEPVAAFQQREALYDRALGAAPNDPDVLSYAAFFCGQVGRHREGLALARRAFELDPLAPFGTDCLGILLGLTGRYDEASRLLDSARTRWPEHGGMAGNAIIVAAARGDRAELEAVIGAWSAAAVRNTWMQQWIWFSRNRIDPDLESIGRYLERQRATLARTGAVTLMALCTLDLLGLTKEAYELIDEASFVDRELSPSNVMFIGAIFSRLNESLSQDPRFPRLCAKLGLCDYWIETSKWPDCADEVPYDFRVEARKVAAEGLARRV